jgi:hypothetical protein
MYRRYDTFDCDGPEYILHIMFESPKDRRLRNSQVNPYDCRLSRAMYVHRSTHFDVWGLHETYFCGREREERRQFMYNCETPVFKSRRLDCILCTIRCWCYFAVWKNRPFSVAYLYLSRLSYFGLNIAVTNILSIESTGYAPILFYLRLERERPYITAPRERFTTNVELACFMTRQ